jgi:hypothetical protein
MSKVISFRLDDTNPREAGALDILNQWSEAGYSIRFVITKALLERPSEQTPDQGSAALPEHFLAAIKQGIKPGVKSD